MNIKRKWIVASATIAVAGFAGAGIATASDDVDLKDQQPAPVVQLKDRSADDDARKAPASDSGSTADSANSPTPPPAKPAPAKVTADSANSPAPAPARAKPAPAKIATDSANSPAPAQKPHPAPVYSADSPASIGDSDGSADSGD